MKLWQKDTTQVTQHIIDYTAGNDRNFDLLLARYDVWGSIAHAKMLSEEGLLTPQEFSELKQGLDGIYKSIEKGKFAIDPEVEDVHSQIELLLTQQLGQVGKKIHSARSRNDQVLVDLRLFFRDALHQMAIKINNMFNAFTQAGLQHQHVLMPGYTHLQAAMPSSFGLWLGAYAEALKDNLLLMQGYYRYINRNPLGSAAGYGSSFPINRERTTQLLGFEAPARNVVYAQMGRGKTELIMAQALANIAADLNHFLTDACLYMGQDFALISLPDALTTGSSIMPHKKNPDVFEISRGKCNQLATLPVQVSHLTTNLPSGYQRDYQLLKEIIFPALTNFYQMADMLTAVVPQIQVNAQAIERQRYQYIFSVEAVNQLVLQGSPFREAYQTVGKQIEKGEFEPNRQINHTHLGSVGNPGLTENAHEMERIWKSFDFESPIRAIDNLLKLH